ncbi:MAG: indole-3-glycerol phosphate synthase TrpC [Acidobacteriales bacterium]|nr:indole-3-glycerol phosphate synthase TrpC [Terriglobales bacterium]
MEFSQMVEELPDILSRIVARKRVELGDVRARLPELEHRAVEMLPRHRDFRGSLVRNGPAIIAEIKKASPSKGLLAPDFNPVRSAQAYQRGGAAALSVLTDEQFFQGSLAYLGAARAAVKLPVLRKDFIIDPAQIIEAAAHSADAILLIAAILTVDELRHFRELAGKLDMSALVEVHDRGELDAAIDSGAAIIGVNNRNLRTFEVTLDTSLELAQHIPANVVKVAESGIHTRADIASLAQAGFQAFLIGERLMLAPDPSAAIEELIA